MEIEIGKLIKKAKLIRCGDGEYPVLSMTMHDGLMFQNDRFKKQIASVDQSQYQVVQRHQLVESFPIDEGVLAVQELTDAGIVSPAYKIWDVDLEKVVPKYLEFALRAPKSIDYYKFKLRGTTARRRSIPDAEFCAMRIKCPSLDEQKIIVDTIEKTKRVIDSRNLELDTLDDLIKARFVELFGDLKLNSKNWKIVGFSECAGIDTNMIHDFRGYENYPHIGIDSIEKETGRLVGYRTISEDGVISGKYLFTPAHIIYSKIRPNLNKVAMPDFDGLCSADAYPILVKDGICNREYFGYTLRSQYFLDYILTFSNRTNLPKVNKSQVEGFTLPLPPIELQNQFADFVHQVDKSKLLVQKSLDETQVLFNSLMQKYFG